jgi:hypothetical protein
MFPSEFFVPWLVSNIVSTVLILTALTWPRATRVLFVGIFMLAGLFNIYSGISAPHWYLTYAETAILPIYYQFIVGEFAHHPTAYVVAIGLGQLIVGALLTRDGRLYSLGTIGGVIFMLAITPLGIGSALPAPLLLATALVITGRRLRSWSVKLRPASAAVHAPLDAR